MSKVSRGAIPALLSLLPWIPIAGLGIAAPLFVAIGLRGLAEIALVVGIVWIIVWAVRNAARWLRMCKLAFGGTPAELLPAGAVMLDAWPVLIDVCGWVPRTALGQKPPLAQKIWGAIAGDRSSLGPRILRIENAPAGPVAIVALTPRLTAEHIAAQSSRIADSWGADSVEVTRTRPNEVAILARVRDPLEGSSSTYKSRTDNAMPDVRPEDFLQRGER